MTDDESAKTSRTLEAAAYLISAQSGQAWTQHEAARDATGHRVEPQAAEAASWTAMGALRRSAAALGLAHTMTLREALTELGAAIEDDPNQTELAQPRRRPDGEPRPDDPRETIRLLDIVLRWNDAPEQSAENVAQTLSRAAGTEPAPPQTDPHDSDATARTTEATAAPRHETRTDPPTDGPDRQAATSDTGTGEQGSGSTPTSQEESLAQPSLFPTEML